ncbi:MAG: hypothetical protein KDD47_19975, partial [Acidobacteria bacterium]|nr:hypothetical protein [Acidobacteriota bacterium]
MRAIPATFLLVAALTPALHAGSGLTLRLNDGDGRPGGSATLVLRTYEARPIKQGQVCLIACLTQTHGTQGLPFDALQDAVVWSELDDVTASATFESDGQIQTAILEFASPSSGVNRSDGPMAAVVLEISPNLPPGSVIEVVLDPANSFLVDDQGQRIPLRLRGGSLTVLAPDAPLRLAAEGDDVVPGAPALLGVVTSEALGLSSAELDFRYDPAVASGPPQVTLDPRYGQATLDVDLSVPGRILARLDSPDGSLNTLPGAFLSISLPTSPGVPPGTRAAIRLEPATTLLVDAAGAAVPLSLMEGVLTFVPGPPIFQDGFETGTLSAWSA